MLRAVTRALRSAGSQRALLGDLAPLRLATAAARKAHREQLRANPVVQDMAFLDQRVWGRGGPGWAGLGWVWDVLLLVLIGWLRWLVARLRLSRCAREQLSHSVHSA